MKLPGGPLDDAFASLAIIVLTLLERAGGARDVRAGGVTLGIRLPGRVDARHSA